MESVPLPEGLEALLALVNAPTKKAAQKLCRAITVDHEDFFRLILAGRSGLLEPYLYAVHFSDFTPAHVPPTAEQMQALSEHGSGQFTGQAQKAIRRIGNMFIERRLFAAHLLYLPSHEHWSLFYFDQRDRSRFGNHWQHGPHIHYSCEAFTAAPLEEVWSAICTSQPRPPSSEHIRFTDRQEESDHG